MDRKGMSLADEAKAAIAPAPRVGPSDPGSVRVERLRAVRSRFLPYVVGGGALSCGYLSVVVAKKDDLGAVYGVAVTAGILAGLGRPDNFVGALLATINEIAEAPRTRMVIGDFLIGLAWFIGSLFLVFGVVIGVQVLMPTVQVGDAAGPWLGVAFLIAWLSLTVTGTGWTLRWIHRRRPRTS